MKTLRLLTPLLLSCLSCQPSTAGRGPDAGIREPAVAGQFYPADEAKLRLAVREFLGDAVPPKVGRPLALIAPHAGYVYSGQIAADAYRQASGHRYHLVVVLGTNHTTANFSRVALFPGTGFRTPLGVAEIDQEASASLAKVDPDVVFDARVHAREHSVEVQLPFIQAAFPGAKILPLVIGVPDLALCTRLGEALAQVLRGREALLVASSDLSHYPPASQAAEVDHRVLAAAARLDPDGFQATIRDEMARGAGTLGTCACGEAPILTALVAARALGATRGAVVSYAHSGEGLTGDPKRVVGYGAVAFERSEAATDTAALAPTGAPPAAGSLDPAEKRVLLAFARKAIQRYLTTDTLPLPRGFPPALMRLQGAFVTLKKGGDLRGCIGHMTADQPLAKTVGGMALQAALGDPRFPPVAAQELPELEIEISALTPMAPVASPAEIVVGRDGVWIAKDGRSAVFLPQVATEQRWDREELLDQLCRKAGLPPGSWRGGAKLMTFQAEVFREGT